METRSVRAPSHPLLRIGAALALLCVLVAGCGSTGARSSEAAHARAVDACRTCLLERSCHDEMAACTADPTPTAGVAGKGPGRCACLLQCRARPATVRFADCVNLCGPPTETYRAAASCWDAHCQQCPKENLDL